MPEYRVILAEPKFQGNIGAMARIMKNFGLKSLALVNPCDIGDDCLRRAMHAKDVIENAKYFESLDLAVEDLDFIAGTSGIDSKSDKKHLRNNLTPRDFASKVEEIEGSVGIVFGRESYGLYNTELEKCDTVITIPASVEYPILNISHSASIIFYELFVAHAQEKQIKEASGFERDKLMKHFCDLLDVVDYPEHKKKKTQVMFQRILGRAVLSKWEFHTLMGVFSRTLNTLNR
ncbi:MAG: RNA methyltransferase [Methanomassiliicoccales archaeon]|nr:MAG: RNA methyltransferase [Methanomassiliicoccales archaeon]